MPNPFDWLERIDTGGLSRELRVRAIYAVLLGVVSVILVPLILVLLSLKDTERNYKWWKTTFDGSEIKITTENLSKDSVTVYWSTDFREEEMVYQHGEQTEDAIWEPSNNYFTVYYRDSTIVHFGHRKTSKWNAHLYNINLAKINDSIRYTIEIKGDDNEILFPELTD